MMNRLKRHEKQKVNEFKDVTGVTKTVVALDFLRSEQWNLEAAINRYFNADVDMPDMSAGPAPAEQLFAKYKSSDGGGDVIDVDGVEQLISDLGIDASDKALVAFACCCGAENMGEFKREEFMRGCEALDIDGVAKFKSSLPALRRQFDDASTFRDIYMFAYPWACDPGKKILGLDTAIAMWELLFSGNQHWKFLSQWCAFVREHHGRPVMQDTWKLLFDFQKNHPTTLDDFDDSQAWPVLVDEFVEAMQGKAES